MARYEVREIIPGRMPQVFGVYDTRTSRFIEFATYPTPEGAERAAEQHNVAWENTKYD